MSLPSRQVRILPGLGKVHVVHTYDRIVPYVGHKRLSVVTSPIVVSRVRPSTLYREFDRIEHKLRPINYYSPTSSYLNSDSAVSYRMTYVRSPYYYYSAYSPITYPTVRRVIFNKSPYTGEYHFSTHTPSENIYRDYSYSKSPYTGQYLLTYYNPSPRHIRTSYYRRSPITGNYYLTYDDDPFPYYFPRTVRPAYENSPVSGRVFVTHPYLEPTTPISYPAHVRRVYEHSPITGSSYYNYLPPLYYNRTYFPSYRTWWSLEKSNIDGNYYPSYYPTYCPTYYSPLNYYRYFTSYLPYMRAFDDETRLIKAQANSLLRRVHDPVPRIERSWTPLTTVARYDDTPARWGNDNYIHRMLVTSSTNPKISYTTYHTEPMRRYISGPGHLAAVSYFGDKVHPRRSHIRVYDDPVKNDIQLLSYYIARFREQKLLKEPTKVKLNPNRPSRLFSPLRPIEDNTKEIADLREARAQRLAKIYETSDEEKQEAAAKALERKKKREEERLAEEQALAEEQIKKDAQKKDAQKKKEEAARRAEVARQEELAAQAAAQKAAELEKQAEETRKAELAKQAEIEKSRQLEEERARLEEEKKAAEAAKAEEERLQLLRLEEIARQAEEEKEAELARQAEELAELARQEAELAEQARVEEERLAEERKIAEAEELAKQEAELAELERQEQELAEQARVEAAQAERRRQEAEVAEYLRQQAELDALEAEARAMLEPVEEPKRTEEEEELLQNGEDSQAPEMDVKIETEEPVAEEEETPALADEPTHQEEEIEENKAIIEEPLSPEPAADEPVEDSNEAVEEVKEEEESTPAPEETAEEEEEVAEAEE